ncbi:MAG: ubiquinol-cytochrome c reductase iron-sulfur subunit [Opitutales bacterium]
MKSPHPSTKLSRRGFVALTFGWVATAFAGLAAAGGAVRFLVPNVLYEPDQRFKAGRPEDVADGSINFIEDQRVFLLRRGNTFRCLSAVCTHLGCTVNQAAAGFHCPCHGSTFDGQGKVTSGPAPRALAWFLVTLSKDGQLLIDKNQPVAADQYLVV